MSRQIIVTLCREYGSLGHLIAEKLAEKLNVKLYDKEILNHMAEKQGFDHELIKNYDEKKRKPILSRTVKGFSNSIEDVLAEKIFEFQRELADSGESFVIVGRCSDYILRDNPNVVRIFIRGDYEQKLNHLISDLGVSPKEAVDLIDKMDKNRRSYHNHHCDTKWGDSRAYDLTMNSSRIGVDNSVELLYDYVHLWLGIDPKDNEAAN